MMGWRLNAEIIRSFIFYRMHAIRKNSIAQNQLNRIPCLRENKLIDKWRGFVAYPPNLNAPVARSFNPLNDGYMVFNTMILHNFR